ncbi:MAG: DUF3854 domain-containing protein [Clostridiales bacterium]|nr:DUF3854 domain-containing protein [Clostridiales bacterium]
MEESQPTPFWDSRPRRRPQPAEVLPEEVHQEVEGVLRRLKLAPKEAAELSRRGFPPPLAYQAGYRTYGQEAWEKPGKLPMWIRRGGSWVLAAPTGLLIPQRDERGLIGGLQVRPREPGEKGKYRQVSSGGFSARVHLSTFGEGSRLWITEGPLKADIAALYTGERFVGLPGVSNFRGLPEVVSTLKPREVVLAFDADYKHNPHVQYSLRRLSELLDGLLLWWAVWEEEDGKGIDDVLVSRGATRIRITRRPPWS